ncbi:sigma-70 family RNA polymerase sigma factor [Lentibacillus sp. N15]|uniref:sigma-70 family RNA polymerase sigma factor n=1 Tax=Lentibacillus songyuanensis TaxID=3136161 RepID=UPI0031BA9E35
MSIDFENAPLSKAEMEFISFINICIKGRSLRIRKKSDNIYERERLILNEPYFSDGTGEEKINMIPVEHDRLFDEEVVNRLIIENAIRKLDDREQTIIYGIFWEDKKISQICGDLNISKNTVLKVKKMALNKMRDQLVFE